MRATWNKLEGSKSKEDSGNEYTMISFLAVQESNGEGNEAEVKDDPTYDCLLCAFEETHEAMQYCQKKSCFEK